MSFKDMWHKFLDNMSFPDIQNDTFGRWNMFSAEQARNLIAPSDERQKAETNRYIDYLCDKVADAVYADMTSVTNSYGDKRPRYNVRDKDLERVIGFFESLGYNVVVNKEEQTITISWES